MSGPIQKACTAPWWWLGTGLALVSWIFLAHRMHEKGNLTKEPNFLSLKGSPYGRTIAYAMRGPADLYWHRGQLERHDEVNLHEPARLGEAGELGSTLARLAREFEEHEAEHHGDHEHEHEHEHDHGHETEPSQEQGDGQSGPTGTPRERMLVLLKDMHADYYTRTNHMGDTPRMRAWRMGEAEKRLKLSYDMDPCNLICYGSYFLFLSESVSRLETDDESELRRIAFYEEKALRLALGTVDRCWERQDEPSAMLTAASAANDATTILARSKFAREGAAETMSELFRKSLERYVALRDAQIAEGAWERYSVYRQQEMQQSFALLNAVYSTQQKLDKAGN